MPAKAPKAKHQRQAEGQPCGTAGAATRRSSRKTRKKATAPKSQAILVAEQHLLLAFVDQRQLGPVVLRVALQEIDDAVAAGIEPGGESRPGHRGLRGDGRLERRKGAFGLELRQVGQLAFGHPLLGEPGVGAVEADHDRLGSSAARGHAAGGDQTTGERSGRRRWARRGTIGIMGIGQSSGAARPTFGRRA